MRRRFVLPVAIGFALLFSPTTRSDGSSQVDSSLPSDVPKFVDPGFESFRPAQNPISGWYSDDLMFSNDPRFGEVTMTPDSQIKVEGQYSLRIEQIRPRPEGQGQVFLAQAVNLSKRGAPRKFDLSVQMRGGLGGPVRIDVYVWDAGNAARVIASRDVNVTSEWKDTTVRFKVPRGHEQFGVWFYLPRDPEAQLWLDDVRLVARTKQ